MGVSLAGVVRWVAGGGSVLSVCGLVCVTGAYVVVVVVCGSLTLCLCVPVSVSLFRCIPCVSSCVSKLIYLLYLSHWYRLSVVCPVWTFSSY